MFGLNVNKSGMSLLEVLVGATLLIIVVFGGATIIRDNLKFGSMVDYYSRAWDIAVQEMEALKHINYGWLKTARANWGGYSYKFDENSNLSVVVGSGLTAKDQYKVNYFNSLGLKGSVRVYLDEVKRTSGDVEDVFMPVTIVVCYQDVTGKVVGEDKDLNGKLTAGEDKNGNGRIDSPVLLKGVIYDI